MVFLLALGLLFQAAPGSVAAIELFTSGTSTLPWSANQTVCYRIPSLVRTGRGSVLAIVAERLGGCSDDARVNFVMRKSTDSGATWSKPSLVLPAGSTKAGRSPWTIVDTVRNRVLVFYNPDADGCHCNVSMLASTDDGETWSPPSALPPDSVYGGAVTHGITHRSTGRLVGCMRRICKNSCPPEYNSRSFYSDDGGSTWKSSKWLAAGTTECQVAELADGSLYMNFRPYKGWSGVANQRLAAWSKDAGSTWSETVAVPDLIDWGFADEGSVSSDPGNDVVYFVHPDAHDRSNLTLWKSTGNASTWSIQATVYAGSAAYSDSVVLNPMASGGNGRKVGVLFEADNYGKIVFIQLDTESKPIVSIGEGSPIIVT